MERAHQWGGEAAGAEGESCPDLPEEGTRQGRGKSDQEGSQGG